MDAKRFGAFIAALRKEKSLTQRELAERLHVTDKAVSRWERGVGFPDIGTIEPLADALGVSVLELMRCERLDGAAVDREAEASALGEFSRLAERQRRTERKKSAALYGVLFCVLSAVLLAARHWVPDSGRLLLWLLIAALGIPGLVWARRAYQGAEGRRTWNRVLLRSIVLAVAIMACVIIVTVLYAINRP